MRKPEPRGTAQQKLAVEGLRLQKRARERQEDMDAARREEMAEFEAKLRKDEAELADDNSSGSSVGGRKQRPD